LRINGKRYFSNNYFGTNYVSITDQQEMFSRNRFFLFDVCVKGIIANQPIDHSIADQKIHQQTNRSTKNPTKQPTNQQPNQPKLRSSIC